MTRTIKEITINLSKLPTALTQRITLFDLELLLGAASFVDTEQKDKRSGIIESNSKEETKIFSLKN